MLITETVARAAIADGSELTLARRGAEWMIHVSGRVLMSSRQHGSEEALAEQSLARCPKPRAVLVGGLGLGFTLRAVLDRVDSNARVTVAELVPELVAWNRAHLAELHGDALSDPRCEVVTADVRHTLERARGAFDVILLDVDNGPVAFSQPQNGWLYAAPGLSCCHAALRPGGVLTVWSAGPSVEFERRLNASGFTAQTLQVPVRRGSRAKHTLFIASR